MGASMTGRSCLPVAACGDLGDALTDIDGRLFFVASDRTHGAKLGERRDDRRDSVWSATSPPARPGGSRARRTWNSPASGTWSTSPRTTASTAAGCGNRTALEPAPGWSGTSRGPEGMADRRGHPDVASQFRLTSHDRARGSHRPSVESGLIVAGPRSSRGCPVGQRAPSTPARMSRSAGNGYRLRSAYFIRKVMRPLVRS